MPSFTTMIQDGDSKAWEVIKDVYGTETGQVISLMDKNHASKAVYKRLIEGRKGKLTVDRQKLSGKGRVTEAFVDKISSYFCLAIQQTAKAGGDFSQVADAIWRTYYHKIGDHSRCSSAPDTWCTYHQAVQSNSVEQYVQKGAVQPKYLEPLRYIFEDVTRKEYLERLLHDYSTSPNEAFHSLIWSFCSKV